MKKRKTQHELTSENPKPIWLVKTGYLKNNENDTRQKNKNSLVMTYENGKYPNIGQFIFKMSPDTKQIVQNIE